MKIVEKTHVPFYRFYRGTLKRHYTEVIIAWKIFCVVRIEKEIEREREKREEIRIKKKIEEIKVSREWNIFHSYSLYT